MDVRNYFPDAEDEQIDDLFDYFEDDNPNNSEPIITLANLIEILEDFEED